MVSFIFGLLLVTSCDTVAALSSSVSHSVRLAANAAKASVNNTVAANENASVNGTAGANTKASVNVTSGASTNTSLGYGDATCMRWTGGSCALFGCHEARGPTTCENGQCMCPLGYCATPEGTCARGKGRWVGEHAIRFLKPYDAQRAYVGARSHWQQTSWFSHDDDDMDVSHTLESTTDKQPLWRVALAGDGTHVRIELKSDPGKLMSIWETRRRRSSDGRRRSLSSDGRRRMGSSDGRRRFGLVQTSTNDSHKRTLQQRSEGHPEHHDLLRHYESGGNHTRAVASTVALESGALDLTSDNVSDANRWLFHTSDISHDPDLLPVLRRLEDCHPLEVTWRVRRRGTGANAALEIWHPKTGVALSTGNPGWYSWNEVSKQGMAECDPDTGNGCDGRNNVAFEPLLPPSMRLNLSEDYISEVSTMRWGFVLLALLLVCCCGCVGAAVAVSRNPELLKNLPGYQQHQLSQENK